jgi:hypothetical protein
MKKALALLLAASILRNPVAGATHEIVSVYTTPDGYLLGPAVPGAFATLVRNDNGITTNVHTELASGPGVYSLWWIVFNRPADCAYYLCTYDEPDLAVNATAHVVGSKGIADFAGRLTPGGPFSGEVVYSGPDPTLSNPAGALITLIVRYHGTKAPGDIPQQLTRYEGGCPGAGLPCLDEQIIVFPGDCAGNCGDPSKL